MSPSSTFRREPYWMRCTARSVPSLSTTATVMLRDMAISSPSELRTTFLFLIRILPSKLLSMNDCSEICAAPPMWNVRIVSCVPGSPIDWAAMMPTAMPSSPACRGEIHAVAQPQTPRVASQVSPNGCGLPGCRPRQWRRSAVPRAACPLRSTIVSSVIGLR